ncbi:MAG: S41 family peptidase [Thermoanaerobaculia bacterium]
MNFHVPLLLLLAAIPALAASPEVPPAIDAQDRAAIIDDIAAALRNTYVFPDVAQRMEEQVRRQLRSGAYDRLGTLEIFAHKLTEDLRSVSHDLHLAVMWAPEPPAPETEEPSAEELATMRRDNYGFRRVERLAGNVGYLKLDSFERADLAGDTAVAAMGFLAGSDALIVDLRDNGGGDPTLIQLIASYLVSSEPIHFSSFYIRKGDKTRQFWTHAWVPGTRLPAVPVFILTSGRTFSAAEDLAYSLQSLKRATIVGETTGGGAHPVENYQVKGYPVLLRLPYGRSVNPVTGTDWEGTGVEPDIAAAAPDALAVAYVRALDAVAAKITDPGQKAALELVRDVVEDRRHPANLSAAELQAFAGNYGPLTVSVEGGVLWANWGTRVQLLPVRQDRFLVGDSDDFRIRFERDASGKVVRLVILSPGGEQSYDRDSE